MAVFLSLFLSQTLIHASPATEKKMKDSAKELSYMGQLDRANELIGEQTNLSSGKASGGWDMTSLMLSMVWGAIGTGYFIYGRKQSHALFLLCGIGLCVFPLFISSNGVSLALGLGMSIAPFKLEL